MAEVSQPNCESDQVGKRDGDKNFGIMLDYVAPINDYNK